MSISLHHGFRLSGESFNEVVSVLDDLRKTLRPLAQEMAACWLAARACRILDEEAIGASDELRDVEAGFSPLQQAGEELRQRIRDIERLQRRDPEVDFGCSVAIVPADHGRMGLYYTEQDAFVEAILSHPAIKSFPYWDNTDPPSDVPEEEWARRRGLWLKTLRVDGVQRPPAEVGVSSILVPRLPGPWPAAHAIVQQCPDVLDRVHTLARRRVVHRRLEEIVQEIDPGRSVVAAALEADEWVRTTEEGRRALEVEKVTLLPRLPVSITEELLTAAIPARESRQR